MRKYYRTHFSTPPPFVLLPHSSSALIFHTSRPHSSFLQPLLSQFFLVSLEVCFPVHVFFILSLLACLSCSLRSLFPTPCNPAQITQIKLVHSMPPPLPTLALHQFLSPFDVISQSPPPHKFSFVNFGATFPCPAHTTSHCSSSLRCPLNFASLITCSATSFIPLPACF